MSLLKVVVITHNYGKRVGVRYLTSGVKVYHIPHWLVVDQVSLPTVYSFFPLFRHIVIREQIDVVHGHAAFSSMCHEAMMHARTMGISACFTDHSLFGFENGSSILMNKLLKFTLSDVDHVICVSHTSKENTVLRADLDPLVVSVIPNAVVAGDFTPDPTARRPGKITVVITSRLVYRKGVDLMVAVIPCICAEFPDVDFIIAGDGAKRVDLERMREKYNLQDRVEMLGAVPHAAVRDVLVRGHIFLNTSLTEAFCIAIVEAACCGLLVVSTRVGGVPEVLPDDMIRFASPDRRALVSALTDAIHTIRNVPPTPSSFHARVRAMYDWSDVAERTENVYEMIRGAPPVPLVERFRRYLGVGAVAGIISCMMVAVDHMVWRVLEWAVRREDVDLCEGIVWKGFLTEVSQGVDGKENEEDENARERQSHSR
ncbi:hypothetical protein HKX48_006679 [Thoreauomyces humboldtii]|nr:hypothetical protein HKX48_006679 [Thoreauomyces humboldtii]